MEIIELKQTRENAPNKKTAKRLERFNKLLNELKKRELPPKMEKSINHEIKKLNNCSKMNIKLSLQIVKSQSRITQKLAKELQIVPKNYYRNQWLAIGMAAFGIPIGAAFGASLGNMAFIGLGLPIGMSIGMALGAQKDKKAKKNGNQLNIDLDS